MNPSGTSRMACCRSTSCWSTRPTGRESSSSASCCTGLEQSVRCGLDQTRAYMDRCGVGEGHLVVFDRTAGKPWEDKLFRRTESAAGVLITVWGR